MDASEENRRSSEMERKLRLARVARAKSGYGTSHHSDEIDGNRKMHAQRQRELKDKKDNDKHTQPERNGNQKMRVLEYRVSFDTIKLGLLLEPKYLLQDVKVVGAVIKKVQPDSFAEKSGIQAGDEIIKIETYDDVRSLPLQAILSLIQRLPRPITVSFQREIEFRHNSTQERLNAQEKIQTKDKYKINATSQRETKYNTHGREAKTFTNETSLHSTPAETLHPFLQNKNSEHNEKSANSSAVQNLSSIKRRSKQSSLCPCWDFRMESENDFDFSNPFQPEPDAHSQGRRSQASSRTAAFFSRFSRGKSSISSKSRSPRKTREKIRNKQESKPENAARSDINVDFVNPAHQISRTQNLHTFPSQSHPGMRQSTVYRAQESNASTFSLISRLRTQFAASHDDSVRWTYMGDIVKKATESNSSQSTSQMAAKKAKTASYTVRFVQGRIGLILETDFYSNGAIVSNLETNTQAEQCGCIQKTDAIVAINGVSMIGMPFWKVMAALRSLPRPLSVTFMRQSDYYAVAYQGGFKPKPNTNAPNLPVSNLRKYSSSIRNDTDKDTDTEKRSGIDFEHSKPLSKRFRLRQSDPIAPSPQIEITNQFGANDTHKYRYSSISMNSESFGKAHNEVETKSRSRTDHDLMQVQLQLEEYHMDSAESEYESDGEFNEPNRPPTPPWPIKAPYIYAGRPMFVPPLNLTGCKLTELAKLESERRKKKEEAKRTGSVGVEVQAKRSSNGKSNPRRIKINQSSGLEEDGEVLVLPHRNQQNSDSTTPSTSSLHRAKSSSRVTQNRSFSQSSNQNHSVKRQVAQSINKTFVGHDATQSEIMRPSSKSTSLVSMNGVSVKQDLHPKHVHTKPKAISSSYLSPYAEVQRAYSTERKYQSRVNHLAPFSSLK